MNIETVGRKKCSRGTWKAVTESLNFHQREDIISLQSFDFVMVLEDLLPCSPYDIYVMMLVLELIHRNINARFIVCVYLLLINFVI